MPAEWTRDLSVDGQVIYRQLGSSSADYLQPAPHDGIQYKDTNLYLASGHHRIRFTRVSAGALPAVWELRPVPPEAPYGSIRVKVEGRRVLAAGEKIALSIVAGAS